jgi:hypothetical protein
MNGDHIGLGCYRLPEIHKVNKELNKFVLFKKKHTHNLIQFNTSPATTHQAKKLTHLISSST